MNNTQLFAIGNELIDTIRDVFPQEAEIETCMDGSRLSFVCSIYWKLRSDSNRPNKPSKIVLIILPYEAIEDSNYEHAKQNVQSRFKKFIKIKYKAFDPEHNEPREKAPPNEQWLVIGDLFR